MRTKLTNIVTNSVTIVWSNVWDRHLLPASALVFSAAALVGCDTSISDRNIRFVELPRVQQLWAKQQSSDRTAVFIDPRSGKKFAAGHIQGALNIKLPDVPKGTPIDPAISSFSYIVVYGLNPGDVASRAMTKRLLGNRYKHVWLFAGGLEEWSSNGGEVGGVSSIDRSESEK